MQPRPGTDLTDRHHRRRQLRDVPDQCRRPARRICGNSPSGGSDVSGGHVGRRSADGWWLGILWVVDDRGVVPFRDVAPRAGPPADPPLARLGPAISGALSGLILEDAGRLQMRLGLITPPDRPDRPWVVPIAVRAAFRFEPARAASMSANDLAETVLTGFRRAVEGLARP
jgi:hypothetical protein